MSGFPKLIPAFTAHIAIDPPVTVGAVSKGGPLAVVPFISDHSFIRSEPDYPIKVDAVFAHGSDFIRQDPSGKLVRLDVNSILNDKSGAVIAFKYSGIVTLTEATGKALGGGKDAKTTEFGDGVDAVFAHGSDFIRQDPSGKLVRLDVNSILNDKSGAVIAFKYSGIVTLTEATGKALGGGKDAKTTEFGDGGEFDL
ncbi:uncharacterized protein PAC_11068 [Phialocephala subalpina]|uniref:Uncharacterized protein n=1 Tax=Phialocephala subalpina TaxID=576137 RepID=A0A1L7X829_9HELO|nr:uncharacterized protein PAC_11068 [Phialocephala subalpina]